ncbi:MAG: HEAT repeat domain-containing protein [Bryobacteraceae bacterium]
MSTLISASIAAVVCSLTLAAQVPANTKAAPKAVAPAPAQARLSEDEMRARRMMLDALSDKNPDVRKQAVVSLGLVGAREPFISLVESMLIDKDVYVRLAAVASLVDLKSTRTVGALQKALYDEAPEVTYAAAKQLWAMNDPEGRKAMMAVLSGEAKTSSGFLTLQTRDRLRMLHTPKTMFLFALKEGVGFAPVPGLGEGVSSLQDLLSDSNVSGRATAALLLGRDKSEDVLTALRDGLLDKDASVRAASVHSLALRNDPTLIEDIAPLLSDSRAPVRLRAAAAYVRLVWVKAGSPGSTEMKPASQSKSVLVKDTPANAAKKNNASKK